jgi:hypothetical protein
MLIDAVELHKKGQEEINATQLSIENKPNQQNYAPSSFYSNF